MPPKWRKGEGSWSWQWGIKSPKVMLCSRSGSWWPHFVSRGRHCFQATEPLLSFTRLFIQSVSSEAVPLQSDPIDISSQFKGSAVKREGCCSGTSGDPDSGPGSAPAGGGTLDNCLRSWVFLSFSLKQREWNWMVTFPMISSGSTIVSLLTGYLQPQSVFFILMPCFQNHIFCSLSTAFFLLLQCP